MSLTMFFALCILGVDFLIYFFFKTLYSEKYRTHPRRLPPHYYSTDEQTSPLYRVPARKSRLSSGGPVVRLQQPPSKHDPRVHASGSSFAEPIPFRRVS